MRIKFITSLLFISFFVSTIFAQNKSENYFVADIDFGFGSWLPSSEIITGTYNSSSFFRWEAGTKIGISDWKIIPYAKYSLINASAVQTDENHVQHQYELKKNQIMIGFFNQLISQNNFTFTFKSFVTYNLITETRYKIDNKVFGFQNSIGVCNKISPAFKTYLDLGYDFAKISNPAITDWGGAIIQFGFLINLAVDPN